MNTLLALTWRGALMLAVVASLDWLFDAKINARVRRLWWLLVPLAFLVTAPLPVLPAQKSAASKLAQPLGRIALSVEVTTPSAEQTAASAPPQLIHAPAVLMIALAGSALYLLVVLVRTRSALRRWNHVPLCVDPALLRALEDCKAEAGVAAHISLAVSEQVSAPMILGWRHPRILLPRALVPSLSHEQLRGVLFHELAHVRSLDMPCTCLFTLVCALHWFNPAAHFALRAWAQFREEAADEAAITWLGASSNLAYGETLLHVLRSTHGSSQSSLAALAVVESVGQLRKRLLMIKRHSSRSSHYVLASTIFIVVAASVLLRPVRAAAPADAPAASTPPSEADAIAATPLTGGQSLAIQVGGVTVAVLPEIPSDGVEIEGTEVAYDSRMKGKVVTKTEGHTRTVINFVNGTTEIKGKAVKVTERANAVAGVSVGGITTWKGEAKVHFTASGQSPVTITGNDLVIVQLASASPDAAKIIGSLNLSINTGKSAQAEDSAAPSSHPSYMLRTGDTTVAILAANPMEITARQITRESEDVQRLKAAKIVITIPGQAPVAIT